MALFNANISTNVKLYLELIQVSQDINANTSQVKIKGYVAGTGNGAWNAAATSGNLVLNGVTYPFTVPSYNFSGAVNLTLREVTVTIAHDTSGNKTVSGSVYWNPDNSEWLDAKTVTGSLALTTIPRASKFTASNVTAGAANIPITLTKSPAATTHKAKVMLGNTVICDKDIGANPTNIPLTAAEWDIFYGATKTVESDTLKIILTTLNGTSSLGTDEKTVTATYAATDIPTLTSITIADTNATVSSVIGAANLLQLLSEIRLTANGAAGVKQSTITGYELQVKQGTAVVGTYGANNPIYVPQASGSFTALARVKDSRGRWSDWKSIAFTVLAYERPKITNYKNKRVTSAGVDSIDGTYVKHEFSTSVTSVLIGGVQKNNIRYRIDRTSPTPVTTVLSTKTVLNTAATGSEIIGTYPATSTYDFLFVLTDAFDQQANALDVISSAQFPLVVGINGAAIGGLYDESGATAQIYGSLMTTGVATFNSVPNFKAGTPVVEIPANADLNSYTTPGEYFCHTNDTSQTIANTPSNLAFFLKVARHAGYYQEFTEYETSNPKKFIRNEYNGTWGAWREVLIGYVYEVARGGDANTGWVKYSNRRMEQWKTVTFTNHPITTALGTNSWWNNGASLGTWLTPFTTVNSTIFYKMRTSAVGVYANFSGAEVSNVGSVYFIMNGRSDSVGSLTITVMAEGTW